MKTVDIKFNVFDFVFIPYGGEKLSSKSIFVNCIETINKERLDNQSVILLDRNENREKTLSRNMFVSSAAYIFKEKKYKCRIALIREGKVPKILNRENYSITELDKIDKRDIVEVTSFYIDVSSDIPVVCCEFNSNGPRISDIEFYFRQISSHRMLKISKSCKAKLHMKTSVEDVLESLRDVLKFEIKAKPSRLNFLTKEVDAPFIGNMNALANSVNPKSIRVDAFFRERGKHNKGVRNQSAISFVKKVLNAVKDDNKIAEEIDDFTLEYERKDGSEDFFSLIRGKVEFDVSCILKDNGSIDTKYLFNEISVQFNEYIEEKNG
jgi:hypothetical protein